MNSEIHQRVLVVPGKHSTTEASGIEAEICAPLEVNVIFTDEKRARAALKFAGGLALNLHAHVNLVVVKEVPTAFPLGRPPVAISFTAQRLFELASEGVQGPLDTTVQLYYCRDQLQGLLQSLRSKSLVIIGGRDSGWPTRESRLAKALRAQGHQVIFAPNQ
jgi:hypothetical protein